MSLGLNDLISGLQDRYLALGGSFYDCGTTLRLAGSKLIAGDIPSAGYWLKEAGEDMQEAAEHTYSTINGLWAWHTWLFQSIDFYWPDVEPLTANKNCEAWDKDNFAERALTIAFIDRMRQLIWDEPFYVAWAARPKIPPS